MQQEKIMKHLIKPGRHPTRSLKIRNSTYAVKESTQLGGVWQYYPIHVLDNGRYYSLVKVPCVQRDGLIVVDDKVFGVTARNIGQRKVWKSNKLDTNQLKEMVHDLYKTRLPSSEYPDQPRVGGDLEVEDQLIDLAVKEQEQALQHLYNLQEEREEAAHLQSG
jgi:hypothetical protein